MGCFGGCGGNNCWWIIILILLISCCGCGSEFGCNNGCNGVSARDNNCCCD